MQTTSNYGLQQPQSNDTVDLVTLVTTNTNIIDSQMKTNANAAATAQATANAAIPQSQIGTSGGVAKEDDLAAHLADYAYQTPTIVGT